MKTFEESIVKVLEMAKRQQGHTDHFTTTYDEQQDCLDVVEDFIVNQLGED